MEDFVWGWPKILIKMGTRNVWCKQAPDGSGSALCKLCSVNIYPKISSLKNHQESAKHQQKLPPIVSKTPGATTTLDSTIIKTPRQKTGITKAVIIRTPGCGYVVSLFSPRGADTLPSYPHPPVTLVARACMRSNTSLPFFRFRFPLISRASLLQTSLLQTIIIMKQGDRFHSFSNFKDKLYAFQKETLTQFTLRGSETIPKTGDLLALHDRFVYYRLRMYANKESAPMPKQLVLGMTMMKKKSGHSSNYVFHVRNLEWVTAGCIPPSDQWPS